MQVQTRCWILSATRAVTILLVFGVALGAGCMSDPSGSNRVPVEQKTQADSVRTGIEVKSAREQTSGLRTTVYISVFISLLVSMVTAGLIWVLWKQRESIEKLKSRSSGTASGLSRREKRALKDKIGDIEERLEQLESRRQAQNYQSRVSNKGSSNAPYGFSRSDRGGGSGPEQKTRKEEKQKGQEEGKQDEQDAFTSSTRKQDRTSKIGRDLEQDFNRVENGDLRQEEFRDEYDPARLSIKNKKERLSSEEAPVVLHHDDRGKYLAVKEGTDYLVVPKFDIILRDTDRLQAGVDKVFGCEGVSHNHPYEVQRVEKAARFTQKPDGAFLLQESGQIQLQRYD